MKNKIIIYDKNESLLKSIASDFITLAMLSFCIYISQGSTWWTFVTGLVFIIYLAALISKSSMERKYIIKSKQEAIEWANSLDDVLEKGK